MKTDFYHFDELTSTNTFAKENLSLFSSQSLSVITAKIQTAGRGRRERSWISEEGNLFVSYAFYSRSSALGSFGILLAVTCCQVLKDLGVDPTIKWPNDLLIRGKKVGGILGETVVDADGAWVIVGVGINLNTPVDLPQAITLSECIGRKIQVEHVQEPLTLKFAQNLDLFDSQGFAPFKVQLEAFSSHIPHSTISMKTDKEEIQGEFLGYGSHGEILLEVDGKRRKFFSGEIL